MFIKLFGACYSLICALYQAERRMNKNTNPFNVWCAKMGNSVEKPVRNFTRSNCYRYRIFHSVMLSLHVQHFRKLHSNHKFQTVM